ncbi:Arm DNA-binding domain-containing protein [Aestuariicoccus sp. MJ-SS9]|uniref:Arm DNA-binding domain-containing protein n=1 Tax=Aestuariicoccus sp. MJ-SS9 TaxID=3079855 RepID=UPI002913942D|nr:Arm DNA-binding domain-containing protein [Aestuariicoccus sp. MJ-SS9]MDU8911986.1 Arm DNA-binding domain-containing protein [Aestuariicoccus sp. MJ-SS9]
MALSGRLTKKLVENLGPGRHGDGSGLYLVVDPSGARRWIVRVTVKGQKNRKGAPLRTDFGLGGADIVSVNGGVKTCHLGGAKVGQFGARALELAALN